MNGKHKQIMKQSDFVLILPFNNHDELFEQVCAKVISQGNSRCQKATKYKNREKNPGVPHLHGLNGERSPLGMFIPDWLYKPHLEISFFSNILYAKEKSPFICFAPYSELLYQLECDWYNICQHTRNQDQISFEHIKALKATALKFKLKLPEILQNFDLLT